MAKHGYPEILPLPQMEILPRNPEAFHRPNPRNKCAQSNNSLLSHLKLMRKRVVTEEGHMGTCPDCK
ncbi:hypothetical protein TNCT_148801 [Trichonephila clavata]|uniref:Uncharacterized protein n=1 Tax=Trichonephila clavata TaxID=2740835 RepID=A0A8X6L4I1_TRICU|nr:hypothetical protein TNCT_148801 [Trichonephila clavata]